MLKNIVVLCMTIVSAKAQRSYDEAWQRRYFPHNPNQPDTNAAVNDGKTLNDVYHGIAMGVIDTGCDDGKTNLQIDWLDDVVNHTCFENKSLYLHRGSVHPIDSVEHIPEAYSAQHKCINETITYNEIIPTFGTHRPLWAVYGEYKFLPKQRWLHNLEHGAIAMLYHPCANENDVNILKNIVKSCLYRHVITPYNLLSPTRPLALVAWGHRLEMSKVAPGVVIDFIKKRALQGPEKTYKDGQYDYGLKEHAKPVSDIADQVLCPKTSGDSIEMK